jgi:hypothetical protein
VLPVVTLDQEPEAGTVSATNEKLLSKRKIAAVK